MDANAVQAIMAIAKAWWLRQAQSTGLVPGELTSHCLHEQHCSHDNLTTAFLSGKSAPIIGNSAPASSAHSSVQQQHNSIACSGQHTPLLNQPIASDEDTAYQIPISAMPNACSQQQFEYQLAVSLAAELLESQDAGREQDADVWSNQPVMQLLTAASPSQAQHGTVDKQARRRAASYFFSGDKLCKRFPDSSTHVMPAPADKTAIIQALHQRMGHFGIRRTAALLRTQYWWHGF